MFSSSRVKSDRNGTPTFYENTMRLAAARCFRRFGTKMKQISRLWNKVARLQRSFGPRWGEAATGAANAPARRRQIATFSQLSSNFVPKLPRQRVFKKREIRAGFHFGRSYGSGA